MPTRQRSKADTVRNNPSGIFLCAMLTAACIFGVVSALSAAGAWDDSLALALLAAGMTWRSVRNAAFAGNAATKIASWAAAAGAVVLICGVPAGRGMDGLRNCGLLLIVFAGGLRLTGWSALKLWPLLVLDFLILPFQEPILLSAGYPLRLMSAFFTVALLRLTGCGAGLEQTSILIGEDRLAITDVCSGIGQLGVLLLIAWLLLGDLRTAQWWKKTLYFFSLIPVVVAANIVRLLVMTWLFLLFGERALAYEVHMTAGYGFVLLAVAMLWLVRRSFRDEPESGGDGER